MKLVLVRHGKAEELSAEMDDARRSLTADGIKKLENAMPDLKAAVGDSMNIRLWSSPLLRASQSAKIIADALAIEETTIYGFIASGDFEALSSELNTADRPDCLIIVGHQPYLSDWCQAICGHAVPFKKGAAVVIRLTSLSPLSGTIETPAVSEIVKILHDYLLAIKTAQTAFLQDPGDIENLHQLRINIRKFRSLLSFIRPLLTPDDYNIYQNKMREQSQLFSYLRELDVLQSEWNNFIVMRIAEFENPGQMSGILLHERDEENARLQNSLKEGVLTSTLIELEDWLNNTIDLHDLKSTQSQKAFINHRSKNWKKKIYSELATIDISDLKRVHLLRIKCKKLRYIQEMIFGRKSGNYDAEKIARMKDLQDKLGFICDTRRNIEIISQLSNPGENSLFVSYLSGKQEGLQQIFEQRRTL